MPSAFERVVRSVVRELDCGGALIPVESLRSSTGFQPYCLVSRKPSSSWFWRPRYTCVNLSIKDILVPDAPEPDPVHDSSFHFYDAVDGQLQGSVALAAPGQGRLAGKAMVSGSTSVSMNVCLLRVGSNTWEALHQERRLRQPEPKILQQLRSRGDDVYVVTEVLQTQREVEVTRSQKREGSGRFALPGAMCLQGEGQGHLSQKKTVTIPSGSILAFRLAQLVIGSDWEVLLVPDKKQRTFGPPPTGLKPPSGAGGQLQQDSGRSVIRSLRDHFKFLTDGASEEWDDTQDFQGLQAEVEAGAQALQQMELELSRQLREGLAAVLRSPPALQALEESLEQGLCYGRAEPLDGPAGAVLECLVLPSRELVQELAVPICYLVGALAVLNDTQRALLAMALETGALPGQLDLVTSVLQQGSPWQQCRAISLPPELLGHNWGQEVLAWILLEECGLELQVGAPHVCWEPPAQDPTCALYASLVLLSGLGQEPS
ncbi:gasdermin-D isoform X2 [Tupaia chinensis]|uniref:Gasdermin-D n=1 Tax=Tupaia chinensis TaxID=246437 RepID=L9KQF2_TUPCH|nr:gasdermin-D isoform X2 [Tupaia chinensis]ELW63412.1 Gasdermin-D [Tupaia chinensis]